MLDDSCIIQVNQGSTGTALATTFTPTLPTPTLADSAMIFVIANSDFNRAAVVTGARDCASHQSAAPGSSVRFQAMQTPGGETSWAGTINGVGDRCCWWVAELAGMWSMDTDFDPSSGLATGAPVGRDSPISIGSGNINTTLLDTGNTAAPNANGDDIILACGVAKLTAAGTVPLLSSVADTTAGQPGTWAQQGTTVATTHPSGINIRLDVHRKYTGGVQHVLDATFTWASTVQGVDALLIGVKAYSIPSQRVEGRAATNSTM